MLDRRLFDLKTPCVTIQWNFFTVGQAEKMDLKTPCVTIQSVKNFLMRSMDFDI